MVGRFSLLVTLLSILLLRLPSLIFSFHLSLVFCSLWSLCLIVFSCGCQSSLLVSPRFFCQPYLSFWLPFPVLCFDFSPLDSLAVLFCCPVFSFGPSLLDHFASPIFSSGYSVFIIVPSLLDPWALLMFGCAVSGRDKCASCFHSRCNLGGVLKSNISVFY